MMERPGGKLFAAPDGGHPRCLLLRTLRGQGTPFCMVLATCPACRGSGKNLGSRKRSYGNLAVRGPGVGVVMGDGWCDRPRTLEGSHGERRHA